MEAKLKIKLPSLPNYLSIESSYTNNANIDVKDLSDDDLKNLGKEWTEALLKHARERRKNTLPITKN